MLSPCQVQDDTYKAPLHVIYRFPSLFPGYNCKHCFQVKAAGTSVRQGAWLELAVGLHQHPLGQVGRRGHAEVHLCVHILVVHAQIFVSAYVMRSIISELIIKQLTMWFLQTSFLTYCCDFEYEC